MTEKFDLKMFWQSIANLRTCEDCKHCYVRVWIYPDQKNCKTSRYRECRIGPPSVSGIHDGLETGYPIIDEYNRPCGQWAFALQQENLMNELPRNHPLTILAANKIDVPPDIAEILQEHTWELVDSPLCPKCSQPEMGEQVKREDD